MSGGEGIEVVDSLVDSSEYKRSMVSGYLLEKMVTTGFKVHKDKKILIPDRRALSDTLDAFL